MSFEEKMEMVIDRLVKSGQSEAIAVGDLLQDVYRQAQEEDEEFGPDDAEGILDQFAEAAEWAKKELKKK